MEELFILGATELGVLLPGRKKAWRTNTKLHHRQLRT